MGTVIYCHGFASVGDNPKSAALKESLPEHTVIAPDLPVSPYEARRLLDHIIQSATSFPVVIVGTSLGGFWANYMAQRWDIPCVLVNPSVSPSRTMKPRVDEELYNYATGLPIKVTEMDILQFAVGEAYVNEVMNGNLVHVFLAKDDEVLNHTEALAYFPDTKATVVKEDGGHRFEKHWPEVVSAVAEILTK